MKKVITYIVIFILASVAFSAAQAVIMFIFNVLAGMFGNDVQASGDLVAVGNIASLVLGLGAFIWTIKYGAKKMAVKKEVAQPQKV